MIFRALALLALLLPAGAPTGCSREDTASLPEGAVVAGDAAAVRGMLARLERLEGTPVARGARALRARLEGCDEFVARAPSGRLHALLDEIDCRPHARRPAALRALRGEDDLAFVTPLGGEARLAGSARFAPDGSVALDARVVGASGDGLLGFVLPSEKPAGPTVLSGRDTLLQARFRAANGLDVAALVERGSQGDQLFRLKSELFLGAVLDGTWEAAVYLPDERRLMPPLALALGFRARAPAVAAVEKFIDDLREAWPVHRSPFAVGDHRGACFLDLRILPEFAPCYVAAQRAIVVGWNPASVQRALAATGETGLREAGGVVLHLNRFPEADRRLHRAIAPGAPATRLDYMWERIAAHGVRDGAEVRLRVDLLARPSAS